MILEAIQDYGPITDKQLCEHVNLPINVVNPRRGELVRKGKIEEAYKARTETGRLATYWKAAKEHEIEYGDER